MSVLINVCIHSDSFPTPVHPELVEGRFGKLRTGFDGLSPNGKCNE